MHKSLFFILACYFLVQGTSAVYFQFFTLTERCLIEDYPENEQVIGHYENKDADISTFKIRVVDPKNKDLLIQNLGAKGKFSFTTKQYGIHKVCFSPIEGEWYNQRSRTRFSIRLTTADTSYEDLANKEHLSQLQILIMRLKDHAEDFIKMQENNREAESEQVEKNQNVNERVIYTTVFQTLVILISGVYQIYSLRKYFIQKKLL